jgi:hypothetical protein
MRRIKTATRIAASAICLAVLSGLPAKAAGKNIFRAGAYAIDVTPRHLPVLVSGMFLERASEKITDPLHARCLVLDDGATKIAIAVVDSCMMPRDLLDRAKDAAAKKTGIPADRILISATHSHSAASAMGVLGTPADAEYVKYLPGRIAEGIDAAASKLQPARIGWSAVDDYEHTHCRRWIYRPDKVLADPFGGMTARANMHPGYENPNAIAPSGPVDPQLSVVSIQSPGGDPIALLANYSMHYFGSTEVSADYYGLFPSKIANLIGAKENFVGIMSQGTSGDQMWMDYSKPKSSITLDRYASEVAQSAYRAYQGIEYHDWVPLGMVESRLTLQRRVPDAARLAWAREIVQRMNGGKPKTIPEVYALEQVYLHDDPTRELKLQAIRIGDLGIAAIPDEVYALSGLKIKAKSPFRSTFTIELANGAEGYIPPPEQHQLGGYTTWPARTAGLEVQAEPRIVEQTIQLMEKLSGKSRRKPSDANGAYAQAVLASKPAAYWRMSDMEGSTAFDTSGNLHPAIYEPGIVHYLTGPESAGFSSGIINRAAHFAGGRLTSQIASMPTNYSVEMWFWNGLSDVARSVTGYLFARGAGDALAIGGSASSAGHLVLDGTAGHTAIPTKSWNQIVLVRDGDRVAAYLNGNRTPELQVSSKATASPEFFIGGRDDHESSFEGKIDEVSLYPRALSTDEVAAHYQSAGL